MTTLNLNPESLVKLAGGKLWENHGKSRVYFNDLPALFGLSCTYYNTGNICSASINGESISNNAAKKIIRRLYGKLWFDCSDGQFHSRDLNSADVDVLVAAITAKVQPAAKTPRSVMTRAWSIAREAAAKFGGSSREYLAEALKMAWAE